MEELLTVIDTSAEQEIENLEADLLKQYEHLAKLRRALPPKPVADYNFTDWSGKAVALSDLFGDKNELILVHNMGKGCRWCTLWADGFIGFTKHLENRAAFVLTSPDDHETQRLFARDRGWNFRCVSTKGTTFKADMGFEPEPGKYWPGVSTFRKDSAGNLFHVSKATFGPGDPFCSVWHFFDLLPSEKEWEPQYRYGP